MNKYSAREVLTVVIAARRLCFTETYILAYRRGWEDCDKDRRQLWRRTVSGIKANCASEWEEDMSENWSDSERNGYCDGWQACGLQPVGKERSLLAL